MQEIDRLKERHKLDTNGMMNEIKMLNEKSDSSVDKESYRRLNLGIVIIY